MADKVGSFSDRSIIAFRDRMTGGGARSNLFEVNIELPAGVVDSSGEYKRCLLYTSPSPRDP